MNDILLWNFLEKAQGRCIKSTIDYSVAHKIIDVL